MKHAADKPFFSLKWKAGLLFGSLVLVFHAAFPLIVHWNMQQKFELFRQEIQQQYQQQLLGQLKTGNDELQRLAEFILAPTLTVEKGEKVNAIIGLLNQYQSDLELNWNVTQAKVFDRNALELGGWGAGIPAAIKSNIAATADAESVRSYINCRQGCRQYQLLPVLSNTDTRYVLVLGYDITNILLAFRAQTGADIAVLSKDHGGHAAHHDPSDIWDRHVNALTSFNDNIGYLTKLAELYPFNQVNQHGLLLRDQQLPVEFQFIRIDNVDDLLLVILDDIAGQQEEVLQITYRNVLFAISGTLVIGVSLFFFMASPLRRLSAVSQALPLLASHQYFTVRELVGREQSRKKLDELDLLEHSTHHLSEQLEELEQSVRDRTDALNHRTTELKNERDFIKNLIDTAQLMIITLDKDNHVTSFNNFAEALSGCREQDVLHGSIGRFITPTQWPAMEETLQELNHRQLAVSQMETEFLHKDGTTRVISWLHSSLTVPTDDAVILSVGIDITDKKRSEAQMLWMINHDALTELYNRRKFNDEFERILKHSQRYQRQGMLLFLDLDQFKDINDSCGHKTGDQLLLRVAKLLRSITRGTDIIARLGGDEFAVIMPESDIHGATTLSEKIIDRLNKLDFIYDHVRYGISCSIGITRFPHDDLTVEELISNADLAMYQAKSKGKNTWHQFSSDDMARAQLQARVRWKQKIEDALKHEHFVLYYQPIMDIRNRQVARYEVLLRMRDEDGKILLPGSFIQVAEQTGLIRYIDHYVLKHGIAKLAELQQQGQNISLSLNLSGHAIVDPELKPLLERLLAEYSADPTQLIFELTETAAVADIPQARELMNEMKKLGCRFSVDDFGTGFASFRYLRELPVDVVKIDGSFITHLTSNADDRLFVQALVMVARGMGKQTVAEFVENAETLAMLQALGVDYAQGYFIGRPQPELLSGPLQLD